MKVIIEIPEFVSEEEIKEVVRRYVKKKGKYIRYYELLKEVDWNELKREVEDFRRTFRLGERDG